MTGTVVTVGGWEIRKMDGRTITHPFIAVAPGCRDKGRHPTRECGCKVHRSVEEAIAYIHTQIGTISTTSGSS